MNYLWSFLIFLGISLLSTVLAGIFGLLVPIIYILLGFILGTESIILGLGALLGNLINLYTSNKYIKTQGAMSPAPYYSRIASIGYIMVFCLTIIARYLLNINLEEMNYWYIIPIALFLWIILTIALKKRRTKSVDDFYESVISYKIIAKYEDDPKWATYLHFKDGTDDWNRTILGSFRAKDPENDLTFVFETKEEALSYAQKSFQNAEYIEEY